MRYPKKNLFQPFETKNKKCLTAIELDKISFVCALRKKYARQFGTSLVPQVNMFRQCSVKKNSRPCLTKTIALKPQKCSMRDQKKIGSNRDRSKQIVLPISIPEKFYLTVLDRIGISGFRRVVNRPKQDAQPDRKKYSIEKTHNSYQFKQDLS